MEMLWLVKWEFSEILHMFKFFIAKHKSKKNLGLFLIFSSISQKL